MAFAGRKLLQLLVTVFLVSLITFAAFQIIPGDPARVILGINASEEQVAALRTEMGLDRPVPERYAGWMAGLVTGDAGQSTRYAQPVSDLIAERIPVTLTLAGLGLLMTLVIGIPLGLLAVRKPGGWADRGILAFSHVNLAIPPFVLGILLTLLFGFVLRWIQVGRYHTLEDGFLPFAADLLIPALALALPRAAMTSNFLRGALLSQLRSDYVRTARSKGASDRRILLGHVLQNAMIPVLSMLGVILAELLGGSLIIEQVFNLPGVGRLLLMAIGGRDFPLIQTIVVYIAAMVVLVNTAIDLLYRAVDPRIHV